MREVITIQVDIDESGTFVGKSMDDIQQIGSFAKERIGNQYKPRAILVDLEPGTIDSIRSGPLRRVFSMQNCVSGKYGAGNNFSKGFYGEGQEIMDQIFDVGFQLIHSICGGTGSGLGTRIIKTLSTQNCYSGRNFTTFSLFPSSVPSSAVETYNAVLAINQLRDNADMVFCLDNDSLERIAAQEESELSGENRNNNGGTNKTKKKKIEKRRGSYLYRDLNRVASRGICGVTSSIRRRNGSGGGGSLMKMAVNLLPYHRLHFFSLGHIHMEMRSSEFSQGDFTSQLFNSKNHFCTYEKREFEKYLSVGAFFEGSPDNLDLSHSLIERNLAKYRKRNEERFFPWVPSSQYITISTSKTCSLPPLLGNGNNKMKKETKKDDDVFVNGTIATNSTAFYTVCWNLTKKFNVLFRRKAYVYGYLRNGDMDELEMCEAVACTDDLGTEYERYQHSVLYHEQGDDDECDSEVSQDTGNEDYGEEEFDEFEGWGM